jgi:hypothetical protein
MKANTGKLFEMCVENGIEFGWRKAHKHSDNPTEGVIKNEILHAINLEFYEWFDHREKQNDY